MSPGSFDPSIADGVGEPPDDLVEIVRRIEVWCEDQGDEYVDPRLLGRDLCHEVPAVDLARALTWMVEAGRLVQVFKVVAPSGVLTEGDYERLEDVPEETVDAFMRRFRTEDTDVIPVLRDTRGDDRK